MNEPDWEKLSKLMQEYLEELAEKLGVDKEVASQWKIRLSGTPWIDKPLKEIVSDDKTGAKTKSVMTAISGDPIVMLSSAIQVQNNRFVEWDQRILALSDEHRKMIEDLSGAYQRINKLEEGLKELAQRVLMNEEKNDLPARI